MKIVKNSNMRGKKKKSLKLWKNYFIGADTYDRKEKGKREIPKKRIGIEKKEDENTYNSRNFLRYVIYE